MHGEIIVCWSGVEWGGWRAQRNCCLSIRRATLHIVLLNFVPQLRRSESQPGVRLWAGGGVTIALVNAFLVGVGVDSLSVGLWWAHVASVV